MEENYHGSTRGSAWWNRKKHGSVSVNRGSNPALPKYRLSQLANSWCCWTVKLSKYGNMQYWEDKTVADYFMHYCLVTYFVHVLKYINFVDRKFCNNFRKDVTLKLDWTFLWNRNKVVTTNFKLHLTVFNLEFHKMIINLHVSISHFLASK